MDLVERIANAVLYEGYRLFPYSPASIKNSQPSLFGVIYPQDYNKHDEDASAYMQTECIMQGSNASILEVNLRFLQLKEMTFLLSEHTERKKRYSPNLDKRAFQMHGYVERKVQTGSLHLDEIAEERHFAIEFAEKFTNETLRNAGEKPVATCLSKLFSLKGSMAVSASRMDGKKDLFKIRVRITNVTTAQNHNELDRDTALQQSFLSTHLILRAKDGTFISLTETDGAIKEIIKGCKNINMWPVLVRKENDVMLSSPIILYDYPEIAPESTGDFFESTEIEEYLLLHIALLSNEERERFSQGDEKLRSLFENVKEIGPEQMLKLHGTLRFTRSNQHENSKSEQKGRE